MGTFILMRSKNGSVTGFIRRVTAVRVGARCMLNPKPSALRTLRNRQYYPAVVECKNIVDDSFIGHIRRILWREECGNPRIPAAALRGVKKSSDISCGGVEVVVLILVAKNPTLGWAWADHIAYHAAAEASHLAHWSPRFRQAPEQPRSPVTAAAKKANLEIQRCRRARSRCLVRRPWPHSSRRLEHARQSTE
jgi:hypothetical protein